MANIKSAKKRVLIAERNRVRNVAFKTSIKTAVKKVLELAKAEDKDALKALEEFCNITATGLYNLQAVIDPDKIAIGGGISKQPILLEYLQKSLDKIYQSIDVPIPQVNIVRCKYDNDSNLIGALANYKKIYNC